MTRSEDENVKCFSGVLDLARAISMIADQIDTESTAPNDLKEEKVYYAVDQKQSVPCTYSPVE